MPISMRMSCTAISLRRLTPPPPHLRRSPFTGLRDPRSGATLVELCVAMVLLVIVFVGWVRMNNIQAVNKESLRYAAIEKAAGMLDAVASVKNAKTLRPGAYLQIEEDGSFTQIGRRTGTVPLEKILPIASESVTIGYQCHVEQGLVDDANWGTSTRWIVCDLFDEYGDCRSRVDPFSSFKMAITQ